MPPYAIIKFPIIIAPKNPSRVIKLSRYANNSNNDKMSVISKIFGYKQKEYIDNKETRGIERLSLPLKLINSPKVAFIELKRTK